MSSSPRLHIARSGATLADGAEYQYAYLRYEVWDGAKGRYQPKPLASLGRTDRLDAGRTEALGDFLKEWLRKDSSLPFEALRERFKAAEPAFQIICSRDFGLRFIVEQAWAELGYSDAVAQLASQSDKGFRVDLAIFAMVLVQLVAPQSKRGVAEWKGLDLFFPEGEELTLRDLYAAMDVLEAGYESVERKLNERLRELGVETTRLAHDTTTQEFFVRYDDEERAALEDQRQERGEAVRAATVNDPPLRMRGHSKAHRPELPQVKLEAVLGDHTLVVHHEVHSGNTSDQTVTKDTVKVLKSLGYKDVRWAGDAGTNSAANRAALRRARFEAVLGEGTGRTKVVREVLSRAGRFRPHPERSHLSYKCVVTEAREERRGKKAGRERLYIIRHNAEEEQFTLHRIERHLERIQAVLDKGSEKEAADLLFDKVLRRYLTRDGRTKDSRGRRAGPVIINRAAVERMRHLAGKSVIATDVCDADPIAEDDVYRDLFGVEAAFRQLQSTIRVGPIRHRRADRIRAHVMIAIMAFNLGRWLERKSGLTLERLQRTFRNLRVNKVSMGKATYWERVEIEPIQRQILCKMGYHMPPKRFTVAVLPPSIK